jgi:3-hydroxy-9,10-secoandrosta-1,3,5(10)-triene-9,17-dione monooxygenase reductase component
VARTLGTVYAAHYRDVMGHLPTGVSIVTSHLDHDPVGMAVGSVVAVSLDPPLIAFLPAKTSTTWPKIQRSGRFCVNVLGSQQQDVARAFAASGGNKFAGIRYRLEGGLPVIEGAVVVITCSIYAVHDAGDHDAVFGLVEQMTRQTTSASSPLLFFRGGYESIATSDPS